MEEDLSWVVGGAIEIVLFTADHTGVADWAEVDTEFAMIVFTNVFIEHLRDPIYGLWLKNRVHGCVILREMFTAEDSNSWGHKNPDLSITGDIQSVDASIHVDVGGAVRESFSEGRENGCQVDDIIDFIVSDDLVVALGIGHIQQLVFAGKAHLFVWDISSDHIVLAYHLADSVNERDTDLALATCHQDSSVVL